MIDQPAYLRNLKAYYRRRYEDDAQAAAAGKNIVNESDRGAIILSATNIEDMLEFRLVQAMPLLNTDDTTRRQIFENDGPIASFSRKLLMAYAMGIVDEPYRKKIDLIREIRNACAHSRNPISLDIPEIRVACEIIVAGMRPHLKDQEPETIKYAYLISCAFVAHYIATGERVEGYAAQMAHWQKLHEEDGTSPPKRP